MVHLENKIPNEGPDFVGHLFPYHEETRDEDYHHYRFPAGGVQGTAFNIETACFASRRFGCGVAVVSPSIPTLMNTVTSLEREVLLRENSDLQNQVLIKHLMARFQCLKYAT